MRISDWSSDVCSADLPNPNDPWESYNRSMYAFNTKVDNAVLKPVAKGYNAVTPEPVRTCIHNMFNNVRDIWSAFNSRSEERRVGKECVSTCRSRWSTYQ